jgi:uncharacterized protein (TIGR02117 family)
MACIFFLLLIVKLSGQAIMANETERTFTVHVVQERWHTGIVFQTRDIPTGIFPEINKYRHQKYLDVSWGDEHYYQDPEPGIATNARAVLWPTPSVILLLGFSNDIYSFYQQATIMKIKMDQAEFLELCRFISNSFVRDSSGTIVPSAYMGISNRFFLAHRHYSIFRTCNTWVALALKASGYQISTFFLITKNQLFRRMKKLQNTAFVRK